MTNSQYRPAIGGDLPETRDDERWEAVLARDPGHDGRFIYAVASTRIYCRPSCPSRRPARSRVQFFEKPEEAECAGYRECRRCRPRDPIAMRVRQVQAAREYLDQHAGENVTLEHLGQIAKMSPHHLQRTFKQIIGLSPKAYANARRLDRMKSRLREGHTVSRATYDAGYGSGSRAYEQARAGLGMTPGKYRRGGQGLNITYTVVPTAVGELLAAATERGLCAVMLGDDGFQLERELRMEYPAATLGRDDGALSRYTEQVVAQLTGKEDSLPPLDVAGTAFQWQVWDALRRIPLGETRSYQAIAHEIGRPAAARAVARACATNRLAVVIPCHRAITQQGETGGYRWGPERKRQILEQERAQRDSRTDLTVPAS